MPNVPAGPWVKVSSWHACATAGFTFATTPESQSLKMVWSHLDTLLHDPTLQIDSTTIFLTGFSQGGYGTFDAITRHPHKFKAAMPVAGGGYTEMAATIKHLPLWAFHGSDDDIIPLSCSQEMVTAINEAGGNATLTTLQGAEHVIASEVYDKSKRGDTLMSWFMQQRGPTSLAIPPTAIPAPIDNIRITNGKIEYSATAPISITLSDLSGRILQRSSQSGPATIAPLDRTHPPRVVVMVIQSGQTTLARTLYLSGHSQGQLH
jgi:hypothetical protein